MRYESCVTSLSWIPSEAVTGATRTAFDSGFTHYDDPPPAELGDIEELRAGDRFRFANVLRAWIEVDDSGRITGGGYDGGGIMGATTLRVGGLSHTFQAVALPDMQRTPEHGEGWMRFVQTTGGRTAIPAPRPVRRRPFIQWQAPLVWTTLSLTLHADGRRVSFGRHTPWGDEDSPALVTAVETALEQALSVQLMHGAAKPRITQLQPGDELVRQGDLGQDIYLVLDGVIRVERDGTRLAEYGPGAMLGERAALEGGTRTSTLVAVTRCRVASVPAVQLDLSDLAELATGHRREEGVRG